MAAVVWTPAAVEDLEHIFNYIGHEQHSPNTAARVIREIARKANNYAASPLLAAARPEMGPSIRAYYVNRYAVFYRPISQGIEVLRIIHGSRDVLRVFRHQQP